MRHTFETLWPLALIPIGIGYSAWWLTDFRRQQAKLPGLIERARQLGCPITPEEFGSLMSVPEHQNAAVEYHQLEAELARLKVFDSASYSLIFENPLRRDVVKDELAHALSSVDQAKEIIEIAATKPFHCINHMAENPPRYEDNTAKVVRSAAKLIALQVAYEAQLRNVDAAMKWLEVLRQVTIHCHYQPAQLSWIVQVSAISKYLIAINTFTKASWQIPGMLDWIQIQADNRPNLSPLLPSIKGEVAHSLGYLEELQRIGINQAFEQKPPFPLSLAYWQSRQALDAYISAEIESICDVVESWPTTESNPAQIAKLTRPSWLAGRWWLRPSNSWPTYHTGIGQGAVSNSNLSNLTNAGIQIYRFASKQGRFPRSNSEAGIGKDFFYAYSNDSFRLRLGMANF